MPIEIKIKMLDVGDGDAILIHLKRIDGTRPSEIDNLVMVVDGGTQGKYESKLRAEIKKLLAQSSKLGPDIVVCTHYDSDHIGGLIPLAKEFGSSVKEYWLHKVPELEKLTASKLNEDTDGYLSKLSDFQPGASIAALRAKELKAEMTSLLESVKQLSGLVAKIPENKIRPVFAGYDLSHLGWPEVQVLGPTQNYFYEIFYQGQDVIYNELQVINENSTANAKKRLLTIMEVANPCGRLRPALEKRTTATNLASIIFQVVIDRKKYLFTGDAGIQSFERIRNYETVLKNIHWLKVPHHASQNNISKELIELMNPRFAYSSGNRYEDDHVLDCIREITHGQVLSTKGYKGDLNFP